MSENKPLAEQKRVLVRQHMVAAAVGFLNSISVKGTPLQSQVEFLRKKGLNPIEIKSALERAKPNTSGSHSDRTIWVAISYWLFPEKLGQGPIGLLLKLTRLALTMALLVYFCYKSVEILFVLFPQLRPVASRLLVRVRRLLGSKKEELPETAEEQPTEGLILDSFKELREQSGAYLEDSVMTQMQDIEKIKQELEEMKEKQESNVKELKSEIKSVRSLLLSTSQFPQPQILPQDSQASRPALNSSINFSPSGMFHKRSANSVPPQLTNLDSLLSADSGTHNPALKENGMSEEDSSLNLTPETQREVKESVEIVTEVENAS